MAEISEAKIPWKTTLDLRAAAVHVGFSPRVFEQWVDRGIIPPTGWTKETLTDLFGRLCRFGFEDDQNGNRSGYRRLPNVHRIPRKNSLGALKYHYQRRGMRGSLSGEPCSPEFMRGLISKERQRALQTGAGQAVNGGAQPIMVASPRMGVPGLVTATPTAGLQNDDILDFSADELLTIKELVARYKGRIAEGTWANHRSQKTGPPYLRIAREIFYPLSLLREWEWRNLVLCDLSERRSQPEHDRV